MRKDDGSCQQDDVQQLVARLGTQWLSNLSVHALGLESNRRCVFLFLDNYSPTDFVNGADLNKTTLMVPRQRVGRPSRTRCWSSLGSGFLCQTFSFGLDGHSSYDDEQKPREKNVKKKQASQEGALEKV